MPWSHGKNQIIKAYFFSISNVSEIMHEQPEHAYNKFDNCDKFHSDGIFLITTKFVHNHFKVFPPRFMYGELLVLRQL